MIIPISLLQQVFQKKKKLLKKKKVPLGIHKTGRKEKNSFKDNWKKRKKFIQGIHIKILSKFMKQIKNKPIWAPTKQNPTAARLKRESWVDTCRLA